MRGRYFRYLFENLDGGLFHTGSIYDKENQTTTNYIYMAGSHCRSTFTKENDNVYGEDSLPDKIDLLVMGGYTVKYLHKLIDIIKSHRIGTVILPYLAPIQRLVLAEGYAESSQKTNEMTRFLQDPYLFLKKYDIGNIYFLYGNGLMINREPEELESGFHFELADRDTLLLIREMEGYAIPVVRAGYITENGWLFYFGVYGMDIKNLSDFAKEYFSHIENIYKVSENLNEDYIRQKNRLLLEYFKKFGSSPTVAIVMFECPLFASLKDNDSFLTEKEFSKIGKSEMWLQCRKDKCCMCTIRCVHGKDYDNLQHHKRNTKESRFGILMLGNVNLNRFWSDILSRFWKLKTRIRAVGVPNSGSGENWNYQMLRFSAKKDRVYWICVKHEITSAGVVNDIVLSASNNRFLPIDEEIGCCLSGYIVPKEDID